MAMAVMVLITVMMDKSRDSNEVNDDAGEQGVDGGDNEVGCRQQHHQHHGSDSADDECIGVGDGIAVNDGDN